MSDISTTGNGVILIAEDDEFNLLYLKTILDEYKLKFISAVNGKEAVDLCRIHPEILLVLMDIKMPVMDGIEAPREIKIFRQDLSIIAVTAYYRDNERTDLLKAGFDEFISKPVSKKILIEKISKYM